MPKDWWKKFFDENYVAVWTETGRLALTKREVNFIQKVIPLKKHYQVLDLCCGHGRHSLELARRGYEVTGLDYSAYELGLARKEAGYRNLKVNFVKGDARRLKFIGKFDVVLNLFTSAVGYGTEEDTKAILKGVSRSLRKGGYLVVDTVSATYLLRHYKTKDVTKGKILIRYTNRFFDPLTFINHESGAWVNRKTKKKRAYHIDLRVFTYPELRDRLKEAGLEPIKVLGSLRGAKFTWDSKRIVVLAKKL